MKSGFTSYGYLHVITFVHIPSKWVPTTNEALAKGRSCLLPRCRPERSMPVTAHLQNKVHPMILPIYAIGWCLSSFDKQLHQIWWLWKPTAQTLKSTACFAYRWKLIRALPCLSQQVPPTGCDCIVHGPHGLGIPITIWRVVSWGFDLHPVVWLVNPQQSAESNEPFQHQQNHTVFWNLTHSTSHWSPNTNRRIYSTMKAGRTSSQLCEMSSEARKVPHPIPRYTYLLWVIQSPINQLQVYGIAPYVNPSTVVFFIAHLSFCQISAVSLRQIELVNSIRIYSTSSHSISIVLAMISCQLLVCSYQLSAIMIGISSISNSMSYNWLVVQ